MSALMENEEQYRFEHAPVAIGGVGGSGTRLIAAMLSRLGFYMGNDFNPANDNLTFTLLFKQKDLWPLNDNQEQIRRSLRIFLNAMYFQQPLDDTDTRHIQALAGNARLNAPEEWLHERAARLISSAGAGDRPSYWGWKEPNTHIFLPSFLESIPDLKYIHVMRNGLDMAHNVNKAQLHFWGEALKGGPIVDDGPEESFNYWCAAHSRVLTIGKDMGENFLMLNFDDFCRDPTSGINTLLDFLDVGHGKQVPGQLLDMVGCPTSTGQYKKKPKIKASAGNIKLLQALGFDYY